MARQRAANTKTAEATRQKSAATSIKLPFPTGAPVHPILHLQQTIGNQAVQRLLRSGVIQAKLRISQRDDIYEQEADRMSGRRLLAHELIGGGCRRDGVRGYLDLSPLARRGNGWDNSGHDR